MHDVTAALFLAVEDPQRVTLEAALTFGTELIEMAADIALELLAIARPARCIP
jgi:hypothetical protein